MTNIYFIKNAESNIKIGRAQNTDRRLKQLQTANDKNLKIIYCIENCENHFESHIHEICSVYKISGEWFKKDVIDFLLNIPWYKKHMKQL